MVNNVPYIAARYKEAEQETIFMQGAKWVKMNLLHKVQDPTY